MGRAGTWIQQQCRRHAAEFVVGLLLMGVAGCATFCVGAAAWAYTVRTSIYAMEKDIKIAVSGIEEMKQNSNEHWKILREHEKDISHQSERLGRVEAKIERGTNGGG